MQGNQVAVQQPKTNAVIKFESMLKSGFIDSQLTSALAENKGAFVTSLVELYTGDKSLQECDPKRVALEAVKAASLNLPINKALGFAYIVVYKNNVKSRDPQTGRDVWTKVPTPTFVLGYKGFIQLASRTGQYRTINATPVYEGELRKSDRLTGAIDISGTKTSDKVIGYAGYIEYLNGFSKGEYISVYDMAKHALKYSPSIPKGTKIETLIELANKDPEAKKVGWLGNFNDMAVKTLIRRLISKYGYMSIQMQKALTIEQESETMTVSDRNETIEETNVQAIEATSVDYAEVDPETGEVKETAQPTVSRDENDPSTFNVNAEAQPTPEPAEADPGY